MKIKRTLSWLLALVMLLGSFTGCGKEKNVVHEMAVLEPSIQAASTGRYVEKNITLPEGQYALDMVMLSDGRLRIALAEQNGNILLCTQSTQPNSWETETMPNEILSCGNVESVALSSDGTVFCDTVQKQEEGVYQPHIWVKKPEGTWQGLPLEDSIVDKEMGFFSQNVDFTEDGRLFAQIYLSDLREIDLNTGKMGENINELAPMVNRFSCAGNDVYMVSMNNGYYHHDGETTELPDVMKAQIEAALEADFGNTPKMVFWQNKDGYLFFTTTGGLYSYIPGGSVTEELINGSRCSIGDPSCIPVALTGSEDGSFYLLANIDGEPTLCYFTYDTEAPAVVENQLNIFSLYEDEDLTQIITRFQKTNPDISVELEIGLTGEDGFTEADAIRTLNTEILANNGPDLICLDGFNLNTYLEKGVLADLSSVLASGDPLLEQITHCYAQNGKVCAVPTTFAVPALYGEEKLVSQIHDLDSMVAIAKQARAENPDFERIVNGMNPVIMAEQYYDSCSAAWINGDGTLNTEKLIQFYRAMKELYALDETFRQNNQEWIAEVDAEISAEIDAGISTTEGFARLFGAPSIFCGNTLIPVGTLNGMELWSWALAGEDQFLGEGYKTYQFHGQVSNVFVPKRIMGILATAAHPQAAETFLKFMLSDEVQGKSLSNGFPVNEITFNREIAKDGYTDSCFSSSDVNGNRISYDAQWPNAQERQEFKGWVENLNTPASTDRTIRKMVMAQMRDCCYGIITPEEAAQAAVQSLNLYLSE